MSSISDQQPTVFVVDDEPALLQSLCCMFESSGLKAQPFPSADSFLETFKPDSPGCLLLDILMPQMDGMELQERLVAQRSYLPIIFLTGYGDIDQCARAFRMGAFDYLEKPVDCEKLVVRVRQAIEHDAKSRLYRDQPPAIAARFAQLTAREHEIMELLTKGKSVKQIASYLNISAQTAAKHRASVHKKLGVDGDVELVRLVLAGDQRRA